MGEQQQQEKATVGQSQAPIANTADRKTHPAVTMVKSMVASGKQTAKDIAAIIAKYPDAQREIVAFVHSTLGNAFVVEMTPLLGVTNNAAPNAKSAKLGGTYDDKGFVFSTGTQKSQVWLSPGGVSATPNIYLHFHGHRTDYGIDDNLAWHEGGTKEDAKGKQYRVAPKSHRGAVDKGGSGHREAKKTMAATAGKNTIVIMPQGVLGEGAGGEHEGGYMKDLEALGLSAFLDKILQQVATAIRVPSLAPGNISLGGHSAGGYEGIHSAMRRLDKGKKDEALMDTITDVTLYDASYAPAHLDETRAWAFHAGKEGTPTKNVRLVNSWFQQQTSQPDHKAHDLWFARFGSPHLAAYAKARKMTTREITGDVGEKLDAQTKIMQHTQVLRADGSVQADVIVLMFSADKGRDHEPLRDRMIDDAIMSIGEGADGNKKFGRHDRGRLAAKAAELKKTEKEDKAEEPKSETRALPEAKHNDSADRTKPEKAEAPVEAKTPTPKVEKAKKKDSERDELFDELYNEKTGRVRGSKLGRHSDVMVKGKKIDINLTDAQYEFKQKVYKIATQTMKGRLYGGVDDDKLQPAPTNPGQRVRKEIASDLSNMIDAADKAGHKMKVGSGYRAPEYDMHLWDKAFDTIYLWLDQAEREKRWPDDPYGDEAAKWLVHKIANRKAPPGKSNHSNGIAVDLHVWEDGKLIPTQFNNQTAWRASRVFQWLLANAPKYNFRNLPSEAWHYDWTGTVKK
jgi:LAS superfamily LD-carboxypeptidase LdcB